MVIGSSVALGLGVNGAAFSGAFLAIALTFFFAQRRGSFSDFRIVLAGVAVSYIAMVGTSYPELRSNPGVLRGLLFWTMGSVADVQWGQLLVPLIALVVVATWLISQGSTLNALALGDDDAIALGVNLRMVRLGLLVSSAGLTSIAVCVAGGVGFVGLIIPHICRLFVGSDNRRVLPLSIVVGATFLVLVDLIARTIGSPARAGRRRTPRRTHCP